MKDKVYFTPWGPNYKGKDVGKKEKETIRAILGRVRELNGKKWILLLADLYAELNRVPEEQYKDYFQKLGKMAEELGKKYGLEVKVEYWSKLKKKYDLPIEVVAEETAKALKKMRKERPDLYENLLKTANKFEPWDPAGGALRYALERVWEALVVSKLGWEKISAVRPEKDEYLDLNLKRQYIPKRYRAPWLKPKAEVS